MTVAASVTFFRTKAGGQRPSHSPPKSSTSEITKDKGVQYVKEGKIILDAEWPKKYYLQLLFMLMFSGLVGQRLCVLPTLS